MDKASQVLAQASSPGVRNTYRARAEKGNVSYTTLYYRAHGRCSIADKNQNQRYLNPYKKQAVDIFMLQLANFGQRS